MAPIFEEEKSYLKGPGPLIRYLSMTVNPE